MKQKATTLALALAILTLVLASSGMAQTGGGFDLSWWTLTGGGGTSASSGGSYMLSGAIGQPDAGMLAGGSFTLRGGFWQPRGPASPPSPPVYVPLTLRDIVVTPPPGCNDAEPNDIPENAKPLSTINAPCTGSFQSERAPGDDYYTITAVAGNVVNVTLLSKPADASFRARLFYIAGPGNYQPAPLPYTVPKNGTYYVRVILDTKSSTSTNDYTIQVDRN